MFQVEIVGDDRDLAGTEKSAPINKGKLVQAASSSLL